MNIQRDKLMSSIPASSVAWVPGDIFTSTWNKRKTDSEVNVSKFWTLVACKKAKTNSADPDQTASEEAVWSVSFLFHILQPFGEFQPWLLDMKIETNNLLDMKIEKEQSSKFKNSYCSASAYKMSLWITAIGIQ